MTLQVTALYAAIFTILIVVLANLVSAQRAKAGVSILDGGNADLALWIRRHGNLVENIPFALLLMALCEARGLSANWLHAMGGLLLVSRALHLIGLNPNRLLSPLRIAGGAGTQLAMVSAAVFLLLGWF